MKITNNKGYIKWNNYTIVLDGNKILSPELVRSTITTFWNEKVKKFLKRGNAHIVIMFRIQFETDEFATIGKLQRLNYEDLEYYINYLIQGPYKKSL